MTVTDTTLLPETILPNWRTMPRGAKWISSPLDIMFDVDDVLFPTMMSIHDLAREAGLHNDDVEPSWTGWEAYGCTKEVYWGLWSQFALTGGYTSTPPIPEAAEALRRLYFEGHRIHMVTARGFMEHSSAIRGWTVDWLEEFGLPWHSLTFARDKVAAMIDVLGGWTPPDARPTFDYAIDDSPRNIKHLRQAGVRAYLLDHVHNKSHVDEQRVATVTDFVDLILEEHPSA